MPTDLTPNDLEALLSEPPRERRTEVDPDGWVLDVDSGEVLGRGDVDEAFVIDSADKAEWALELRGRIEADIAAVDLRIEAVTKQLKRLRSEHVRRLSWWTWRFEPSLVSFARRLLRARKGKTLRLGWGSVSFRKVAPSHEILDMEAAVAWVKAWAPERVKSREWVGRKDVGLVLGAVRRIAGEEPERPSWLRVTDEAERVTISTGIDVKQIEKNTKGRVK